MTAPPSSFSQSGLTYIEVMIAAVLIVLALLPATDALYTGMRGSDVYESTSSQHFAALALMEDVLAEPFSSLTTAAAVAGNQSTPSSYSDLAGTPDRRLVFVALYDADNADGDGDVFTVPIRTLTATTTRTRDTPDCSGCASRSRAQSRSSKA